jgi:Fe-S cluster biosynthesis and repair protein YggX
MAQRTVLCAKLGQELAGLDAPPFPGALGQRIYENVSKRAFDLWQEESTKLMKARGWNMGQPDHRKQLLVEMEKFLFTPVSGAAAGAPRAEGTVFCLKIGRDLPAMAKPPFPGALGERIFKNISAQGWDLWEKQATILMNHHGLSMADPEHRHFLMEQMEEFFFGEGAQLPADWVPPGAQGGKGGGGGGGKGAPAARKK